MENSNLMAVRIYFNLYNITKQKNKYSYSKKTLDFNSFFQVKLKAL